VSPFLVLVRLSSKYFMYGVSTNWSQHEFVSAPLGVSTNWCQHHSVSARIGVKCNKFHPMSADAIVSDGKWCLKLGGAESHYSAHSTRGCSEMVITPQAVN
jgi:hypothetical protein